MRKLNVEVLRKKLDAAPPCVKNRILLMRPLAANYDVTVIVDAGKFYPGIQAQHPNRWTRTDLDIGQHLSVSHPHVERRLGCFTWWSINKQVFCDANRQLLVSQNMMNEIKDLLNSSHR